MTGMLYDCFNIHRYKSEYNLWIQKFICCYICSNKNLHALQTHFTNFFINFNRVATKFWLM